MYQIIENMRGAVESAVINHRLMSYRLDQITGFQAEEEKTQKIGNAPFETFDELSLMAASTHLASRAVDKWR